MRRADQRTVAHFISFLHARGHAVDLYALDTGGSPDEGERRWLREHCREVRSYRHSRLAAAVRAVTGLFRGLPLQVGMFRNRSLARDLEAQVAAGEYDVVYVYYLRSAAAARRLRTVAAANGHATPIVLALQLSQALNTSRIRRGAPTLADRLLYSVEAPLVARYEARIWQAFSRSILIGEADVDAINASCRRFGLPQLARYDLIPHGTDVGRFRPAPDEQVDHLMVCFSGVMRTPTNIEAIVWFVENVWDEVIRRVPGAHLYIVGREPTRTVRVLHDPTRRITVTGTVDDPASYIARAGVCINPMRAAGGMQNKLIEYLASGRPTVATSVANEGIGAPPDVLQLADTAETFASATVDLLLDRDRARALGDRARQYALECWTWERHFLDLEAALIDVPSRPSPRP
jgi:glycosyltransferase involved in cell wall biosynthesis